MSTKDERELEGAKIAEQIEGLLKKALTLGAGAYLSAEERVNSAVAKTLNTVQIPKGLLIQLVEEFMDNYTLKVNAEIQIVPKDREKKEPKT